MDHIKHIRITPTFRIFAAHPTLSVETRQLDKFSGSMRPLSQRDEYQIRLACDVRFVANNAELEHAKKNALIGLGCYLYSDVLNALREIRAAGYAGDVRTIQEVCSALETEINNFAEDTLRQESKYETR